MTGQGRPRTGRRAGDQDTRADILQAARESFSRHGYRATTMRGVAREAGVDVALVSYYFGSKDALFAATMKVPRRPSALIDDAFDDGADQAGPRLVRMFIELWEDPASGPALLAMFRSAASHEPSRHALSDFASKAIVGRYAAHLPDHSLERSALAASQLVGMAMLRYVIKVEPLAGMARESVIASVGPIVQHYLTGDLAEGEPSHGDLPTGTFSPAPTADGESSLGEAKGGEREDLGA